MSDVRLQLIQLNELLSAYIIIHDDIFAFSFRRQIPIPGIFRSIDFPKHEHDLHAIAEDVRQTAVVIERLTESDPRASQVLAVIRTYVYCLHAAVFDLQSICRRLSAKAEGALYPMREYKADVAEYQQRVDQYQSLGGKVNAVFATL